MLYYIIHMMHFYFFLVYTNNCIKIILMQTVGTLQNEQHTIETNERKIC